ncbi:MAG: cytochrome c3 family protein [Bacteroidota bacterium]
MKTMKLLFTLLFAFAIASVGFGQNIAGSAHDMGGELWNASGEICILCHTPHNAVTTEAVLWNHGVTVSAFTTYTSGTLNGTVTAPDGTSKLCLSCHDGTVGLEDFGGAGGVANLISGSALVGLDLSNDHPVSITYTTATASADGGLFDPSTTTSGLGSTIDADMLFSGSLECASCHDVHDNSNGSFLRLANTTSALCLTCHDK